MGYNDEIKIFNGIIKGNEEVLKNFYRKNFVVVKKFILQNSGNEKDAEDVFQDGLIVLYQKLNTDSVHITCSIHTYFYGICKNKWRSKLRRKHKVSCCGAIDDLMLEHHTDFIDDIEQMEREQLYRKHFSKLNCKCKRILTLFFEGKSMREIGVILNYSEGYVRKKKFECKKYLMEMIEKDPLYAELAIRSTSNKVNRIVS
ncbi:RNA polymerase sigma factor [Aquimarina sp. 2201CG14-23]|uniref:RNA polymerase sigma factor n=1 Tax=Aquimarina mycalae TaxID=3040073 RepID=UPI002477E893|nr:sigma-70 family RNA polymerase sigma factor [Aquimarina sp. 2201CG14-23]MDH7445075.1 sigma-70 family RNA polymerase sigma factor [Aquimarina sp. 2201CG14-23]